MKRAKFMAASLVALTLVSGVFAFKAKEFTNPTLYFATTTGVHGTAVTSLTTITTAAPTVTGFTTLTSTANVSTVKTTLYANGL